MSLSRAALRDDIAQTFGIGAPPEPPRLGLEVEAIPWDPVTARPARLDATLAALAALNWNTHLSAKSGVTELHRPDGARVTFEPGGQIEYSTQPHATGTALLADVDDAFGPSAARSPRPGSPCA